MPLIQFITTATTTPALVEFPGPIRHLVIHNGQTDQIKIRTDGKLADSTLCPINPGEALELRDLGDSSLSYVTNSANTEIRVWCVWERE